MNQICLGLAFRAQAQEEALFTNDVSLTQPALETSPESIWENGVAKGFAPALSQLP